MSILRLSTVPRVLVSTLALSLAGLMSACDGDASNQTGGAGMTGTAGTTGMAGTTGGAGTMGGAGTTGVGGGAGGAAGATLIDTDAVLARFNADGTIDTTFGTNGVARVDLGPGALVGTAQVKDAPWGIARDGQDRLHIFATRKSTGAGRVDADRVVARTTPGGVLDTTFGDSASTTNPALRTGIATMTIATLTDSARHGMVDPDGKIVSFGYTGQPTGVGTQSANRIVIARFHGGDAASTGGAGGGAAGGMGGAAGAAGATGGAGGAGGAAGAAAGASGAAPPPAIPGTFDTDFGVGGIVNYNPFWSPDPAMMWGMAEAYGGARQSTGAYVSTGYGRLAPSGQVNVVCFRWSAAGVFDTTWGGAGANGIFEKDLTSNHDRGRNIVTLPNDRILIVGSAEQVAMNVDGMVMILTANGTLDTTFNTTGYKFYKFDTTNERSDEALYGAAVSPNGMFAAAAGYRNASTTVTTTNDDAVLVIIPLGGGTEFAAAVPFSDTAHDRFWAVTFDANNKIVATGYVRVGNDHQLAVARFNTDGTRDTTFNTTGMAMVNAIVSGTQEEARGVVVQSDGKIVIGGTAEK